ncbi:uncharacterized protein TNCV_3251411 [Trichonephila clavipes]|nr:uncharacterized protein TNCV_3251411 [Trichonephila clavipes]
MGLSQADAARRLNVSRSVVQRLWDQYQSEDSVSEDLFRPTTSCVPAEDRFLALSAKKEPLLCRSSLQTTFKHQEEENGAKSSSQCRSVCKKTSCVRSLYPGQENMFLGRSNNGLLCCSQTRISLGTDLHVFHGGTVTGLRYRDETLDPYVRPYAAAIGNDFILMDDNARPHRARIVEEYLEDHGFGTNGMASSISRPESDRTSLGLS